MIPNLGEQFNCKEGMIAGDECVLITPKELGVAWNDTNKHYRSVVIRKSDGKVINRGFSKFCNWGEAPTFEPWDSCWEFEARQKLDGSLAIISSHNGQIIFRTRGTFDARNLENGHEVDQLIEKYQIHSWKPVFDEGCTMLCEWVTPSRVIVVRESNEPELVLLGVIDNETAQLQSQYSCDYVAKKFNLRRPIKYHYNSVAECLDDVKLWQDKEGVVLYHEPTQTLKKCKAELYLSRHRLKSHISSISNLVDFYMTTGKEADYSAFFKVVEQSLDFELATQAAKDIGRVIVAHQIINAEIAHVNGYIQIIQEYNLPRKEAAQKITAKFNDWRKSYAFMALDNKTMPDKMLADLILNLCKSDENKL
jgi:hypothetical protein